MPTPFRPNAIPRKGGVNLKAPARPWDASGTILSPDGGRVSPRGPCAWEFGPFQFETTSRRVAAYDRL